MQHILNFAAEHGFALSEIIPDGKIHRFKVAADDDRRSGWYVGYQNHALKSGEVFHVVRFGNYRTSETFTYQDEKITLTKEDKKNIKAQVEAARKQEEENRLANQREVATDVEIKWNSYSDQGESDYLRRKQLDDCLHLGIRYDGEGFLIPITDIDKKIWSMQKIFHHGMKSYYAGGRKAGCFHVLGEIEKEDTIRLVEGFATGGSVYKAVQGCVVICFDSGNLPSVAKQLKERYPEKTFVICGDDDQFKVHPKTGALHNAGREKAEESAKLCLGKAVFPKFKSLEEKPTDFNDLHLAEGLQALQLQLKEVFVPKLALYALGFKEKEYFFTSSSNRQIVGVVAFSTADFLNLMPLEYWEALYPSDGERTKVNWDGAKSQLMAKCRERGLFNGFNVRGAGVWSDAGRIVVNMGDHLVVDGIKMPLGSIRSKFFYTLGMNLIELHDKPLSVEECRPLVDACQSFQWTKKDNGILLAGALVLSRACGALPVRPHVWVTGGAETGKTTLLEKLIHPIIGQNALYVSRGTTEAGVRQSLKANSVPVLFDEFETTNTRGDEAIDSIIELCRGAWSDSNAKIVKGGSNGNATEYAARFSAIVSSIRTKLTNDADKGRFTVVELKPHGGNQEHWMQLKGYLSLINEEFSDRLFSRTISLLPVILANQKVMQSVLAKRSGSRFGDQYGMILAGYASLIFDGVITEEDGEWLADQVSLEEEKENTKQADHQDCLRHLWTTALTYDHPNGRQTETIGSIIDELQKEFSKSSTGYDHAKKKALLNIGVRVESGHIAIVATGHSGLQKSVFANTKWSQNWGVSLLRLSGAEKKKTRFDAQNFYAVLVPNTAIYSV